MENTTCIPVSEGKISLNISDLPDWQPYSNVDTGAFNSKFLGESANKQSEKLYRSHKRGNRSQDSWITSNASQKTPSKPASVLGSLLPDDLNISWEFQQPINRDVKGKLSVQIEAAQTSKTTHPNSKYEKVEETSSFEKARDNSKMLSLGATGKRPAGIGTEDVQQEIVTAEKGENSVLLRVTLLAAGFVVGPNGASIHQIEAVTGAHVYSFNRSKDKEVVRPTRQFHIEGPPHVIQHAVDIICHAIQLYKDLAEGNHRGMTVKRLHKLDNVLFRYEPPPRSKVPFAAQVEYDAAELRILQSTKRSRSIQAIRGIREQLARRDEALMRSNLPVPAQTNNRFPRARKSGSSCHQVELGEPDIQDHDILHRQLIDDFDQIVSISRRSSSRSKSSQLNLRASQVVRSVEKVPFGNKFEQAHRSNLVTKLSIGDDSMKKFPPNYMKEAENVHSFKQTWRSGSDRWNQNGLYGIDSFFNTKR